MFALRVGEKLVILNDDGGADYRWSELSRLRLSFEDEVLDRGGALRHRALARGGIERIHTPIWSGNL